MNLAALHMAWSFLVVLAAAQGGQGSDEWPRWRGSHQGVSSQTDLPVHWNVNGEGIRWRVMLDGEGNSSPIVSRGQVFVTTSLPGRDPDPVATWIAGGISLLTGLWAVLMIMLTRRRGGSAGLKSENSEPSGAKLWQVRLGGFRSGVAALALSGSAVLLLMQSDSIIWRWLLGERFSCLSGGWVEDGDASRVWLVVVATIGLGMVAATGWFQKRTLLHDVPSMALVMGAVLWAISAPVTRLGLLLVLSGSVLAILLSRVGRGRSEASPERRRAGGAMSRAVKLFMQAERWLAGVGGLAFAGLVFLAGWFPLWVWAAGDAPSGWWAGCVIAAVGGLALTRAVSFNVVTRLMGAVLLAGAWGWHLWAAPRNVGAGETVGMIHIHQFVAAFLLVGGAAWHVVAAVTLASRRKGVGSPQPSGRRGRFMLGGTLGVMIVLVLVLANTRNAPLRRHYALASFDLDTGRRQWKRVVFSGPLTPPVHKWGVHANPTPVADDRGIVVHFNAGTAYLDYKGRVLWKHADLLTPVGSFYGAGSSPVIVGDAVILVVEYDTLNVEGKLPARLVAYDLKTGSIMWDLANDEAFDSYVTPILRSNVEPSELITATSQAVVAYDATTGERLWSYPTRLKQLVAGFIHEDNRLWLGGGTHGPHTLFGIQLTGTGPDTEVGLLWERTRRTPGCVSPVLYEGRLYVLTDNGVMSCLDPASGDEFWKGRLPQGRYFASLVAADGKVYAISREGRVLVIKAGKKFEIMAKNEMQEAVYASPAIAGRSLLIRTRTMLVRVEGVR